MNVVVSLLFNKVKRRRFFDILVYRLENVFGNGLLLERGRLLEEIRQREVRQKQIYYPLCYFCFAFFAPVCRFRHTVRFW